MNNKKLIKTVLAILKVVLIIICSLITFSMRWMLSSWDELSLEEVFFQLSMPLEGTSQAMLFSFFYCSVIPTIIVISAIIGIAFLVRKRVKANLFLNFFSIISLIVLLVDIVIVWNSLGISSYFTNDSYDFIEDKYVNPKNVSITFPSEKRNLIYIYLESMETTYADTTYGGAYEYNLIPELVDIANQNEDFSGESTIINGALVLPGSGWTSGAMFASSSGLPLKIPIGENEMSDLDSFFPRVTTLGDILGGIGYTNELMIGSNGDFGGRKLLYHQHGDYQVLDYDYAIEHEMIPEDYFVWWGYEDEKLFEFSREELTRLSKEEQPFNFTLLTVDTHFTDGYVCDLCEDVYDEQYANVIACSSKQVQSFVQWIMQQDWYENTTIVIHGDHTTMDSNFLSNIDDNYQRKVFVSYINSAAFLTTNTWREYSTFDLFPTTLAALGCNIEGDRLGLGTNLYSQQQTLTEIYGLQEETRFLSAKSDFMTFLAAVPDEIVDNSASNEEQPTADVTIDTATDGSLSIIITDVVKVRRNIEEVVVTINNVDYYAIKGNDESFSLGIDKSLLPEEYHVVVKLIDTYGDGFVIYEDDTSNNAK